MIHPRNLTFYTKTCHVFSRELPLPRPIILGSWLRRKQQADLLRIRPIGSPLCSVDGNQKSGKLTS